MHRRRFLATPLLLPTLFVEQGLAAAAAESPVAYPAVTPGYRLSLPRDHGAHADFRIEWWYVTGALDVPTADIGFQLTFFRYRPGYAEKLRSPLAARQILLAHAALSWPGDRLQHSDRSARANLGAHFSATDCDVAIGAWRLWRATQGEEEFFRLQAQSASFAFDFTLSPTQAPLLQGDAGYSRKSDAPHGPVACRRRTRLVRSRMVLELARRASGRLGLAGNQPRRRRRIDGLPSARRARQGVVRRRHLARHRRPPTPLRRQRNPLHAVASLAFATQRRQLSGRN